VIFIVAQKTEKLPWVEKYRPKFTRDMAFPTAKVGRQKVDLIEDLKKFVISFFKEKEKLNDANRQIRTYNRTHEEKDHQEEKKLPLDKAAVLLEGPPGIGKTTIAY